MFDNIRSAITVVLCTFGLSGCELASDDSSSTLTAPHAARCELLEGRTFVSIDEQIDCGPSNMPITCNWRITFSPLDAQRTSFGFVHSDVGTGGAVACSGAAVIQVDTTAGYAGNYDANNDQLEWDGVLYEPVAP